MITQSNVIRRWITVERIPLRSAIGSSNSVVRARRVGGLNTRSESPGGQQECCHRLYTRRVGGLDTIAGSQIT